MNNDPNELTLTDLITGRKRGEPLPTSSSAPPPPPPGYVLQAPSGEAASPPPPPPGYVLQPSGASGAAPATEEPSILSQLGRQFVMAGRNVAHGAMAIPGIVNDPIVNSLNYAEDKLGIDPKYRFGTAAQATDALLNAAHVPDYQPQNGTERVVGNIEQAVGGTGGMVGAGKFLAGEASPLVAKIGELLSERMGGQLASAATGATAAGVTREAGGGPIAQMAAGLVGGVVPSVPTLGSELTRDLVRGGEAGRQTVENNVAAFKAAGTMPTAGQATQNRVLQSAESLLAKAPGGAGVMQRAAEQQAGQAAQGIDSVADQLSTIRDPAGAGRTIERGISGAGGFLDRFKHESGALYDKLDQHIPADTRIGVGATAQALDALTASIPGAPNLSRFFQNQKIGALKGALTQDTQGAEAALSRPEVAGPVQALKDEAAAKTAYAQQVADGEGAALEQQNAVRRALGMKPKVAPQAEPVTADDHISELLGQMVDGKLPYEAVKKLRTLVGDEASNVSIASDVPRSKWKALYAALSDDLKGAAEAQGPDAMRAWKRANAYYRAGQNRIDTIAHVVDKSGGPEAIFNAATSGTREGATTLRAVMQSLQPEEQKVLASVVVRRLGRATPGQQNAAGDQFSMSSYLTNWNRLSPEARRALFGRFGPKFSQDMDHLATMAENVRAGSKVFANPSGTAGSASQIGAWASALTSLASGHPSGAVGVGAVAGVGNLAARLMTNPRFVNWLRGQQTKGLAPQMANYANLLNMAKEHNDPDLKAAADLLRQPAPQEQTDTSQGEQR